MGPCPRPPSRGAIVRVPGEVGLAAEPGVSRRPRSPVMHPPALRVRTLFSVLLLALGLVACAPDWESPDEVREAILKAGIIGQPPAEVERRLLALQFEDGRRLALDSFDPRRHELGGALRDAQGRPRTDWNVHVNVTFDSAGKAVAVEAHSSAVNPL
jgi:hypothetical protein